MSERIPHSVSPFSAQMAGILIAIGTLAFIALFIVLAWSPALADKDRAGAHPYSTSALGYGGLVTLLEADGQNVTISRLESTRMSTDGLLIMTVPASGFSRVEPFDLELVSEPALYVLPKWAGTRDRQKPSWQAETDLLSLNRVTKLAADFDSDAQIRRIDDPGRLETGFASAVPEFEHQMQVIKSDRLIPFLNTPSGALLSKVPGREVYILSDPDLLNTFGLARRENARLALGVIDQLKERPDQSVILDATLHGFARSESLLRAIFDLPFLGATLIALASTGLIGWRAAIRLGPAMRETRALAFGKKALAESSAGLVSMARREGQMAQPYRRVIQRSLARHLGLPANLDDAAFTQTADRIAAQTGAMPSWSAQSQELERPAAGRDELRDQALALWRWQEEIKNGH